MTWTRVNKHWCGEEIMKPFEPSDDYLIAFHKAMTAVLEDIKCTRAAIRILRSRHE